MQQFPLLVSISRALAAWLGTARIVSGPLFRAVDRYGSLSHSPVTGHRSREVRRNMSDANLFRASAAGKLSL